MGLRLMGSWVYGFPDSRVPRFPGFQVPGFTGLWVMGSRFYGFLGSRVPGFVASRVPGFRGSWVYGITVSRVLCIHAPANYGVVHLVLVFFINTIKHHNFGDFHFE